MKILPLLLALTLGLSAAQGGPIRALMVCGGCCHDYTAQKQILSEGISARANVEWTMTRKGSPGMTAGRDCDQWNAPELVSTVLFSIRKSAAPSVPPSANRTSKVSLMRKK